MAKTSFRCRVVTPTEKLLDAQATYASIPAWDGLMGVLPGRAPIVAKLGLGELIVEFPAEQGAPGGRRGFFIDGGFLRMGAEELTIIAEDAVPAERLAATEAEAELKEAEARQVPADAENRQAEADRITHDRNRARTKLRIAQSARAKGI
ncbi:MAG: FoF1 ATP synthase subunit delta/epsilon [Phycisphaerales bacterium JB037]